MRSNPVLSKGAERDVRSSLKRLAPLGLVEVVRETRNVEIYASWESAVQAARADYDSDLLSRFRAERAKANPGQRTRSEPLMLCVGLLGSTLEVTDFGGGTGEFGNAVCASHRNVDYRVVECPGIVERMRMLDMAPTFQTSLPESCDIFFTSCTLPYLDDPLGLLAKGFVSARKMCVVARNCFADREYFGVQTSNLFDNGAGEIPAGFSNVKVRYPHRTTVEKDVVDLAHRMGFELLARFDDDSGVVPYRGRAYGGTLVFVRRAQASQVDRMQTLRVARS